MLIRPAQHRQQRRGDAYGDAVHHAREQASDARERDQELSVVKTRDAAARKAA